MLVLIIVGAGYYGGSCWGCLLLVTLEALVHVFPYGFVLVMLRHMWGQMLLLSSIAMGFGTISASLEHPRGPLLIMLPQWDFHGTKVMDPMVSLMVFF